MASKRKTYSEPRRELYSQREGKRYERTLERRQARQVKAWERSVN